MWNFFCFGIRWLERDIHSELTLSCGFPQMALWPFFRSRSLVRDHLPRLVNEAVPLPARSTRCRVDRLSGEGLVIRRLPGVREVQVGGPRHLAGAHRLVESAHVVIGLGRV